MKKKRFLPVKLSGTDVFLAVFYSRTKFDRLKSRIRSPAVDLYRVYELCVEEKKALFASMKIDVAKYASAEMEKRE
jgi:hypothetical protein